MDTNHGWRGCGFGLLQLSIVPLVGGLLTVGEADNPYWLNARIVLGVGLGLFVLGLTVSLFVKREWRNRYLGYSGGLLLLASDRPEPCVMRWDDLVSLTVTLRSTTDEGQETIDIGSCAVGDRSGNVVTAPAPPDQARDHGPGRIAELAEQALTPWLVPGLIRAFDAGDPVAFGDRAAISHEGISYTPGDDIVLFAWPDVTRIDITARLRIIVSTRGGPVRLVDLDGVENAFFAYHVIEHAATGIKLLYHDEDEIPRRLPTPV